MLTGPRRVLLAGITLVSLTSLHRSHTLWGQPNPGVQGWGTEIAAFDASDKANPPPQDAILFLGSSSIRLWHSLAHNFPEHKVINRGFGGAHLTDCALLTVDQHFAAAVAAFS